MNKSIWIFFGGIGLFLLFGIVRGIRIGRRERNRLETLFQGIAESACPSCKRNYGGEVTKGIQISFGDDDAIPRNISAEQRLSTWRIKCPHCDVIALLIENENVFELVIAPPKPQPSQLSKSYVTTIVVLALAVLGASIYSIVRFFSK